jgi:hypothetical protein
MKVKAIRALVEVDDDLEQGRVFYASQQADIGEYFWDSLLADIGSLSLWIGRTCS